jgi:hypothetical protein
LSLFELFIEDDVFAGQLEGGREKIILVGLLFIILFIECSLEFLEILVEHVLAAELVPPPKVVDFHMRQNTVLFEDPIHLLLLAPDYVPVIVPRLLPLPIHESVVDAVLESGLELDAAPESSEMLRRNWIVLLFYVPPEVFTHMDDQ